MKTLNKEELLVDLSVAKKKLFDLRYRLGVKDLKNTSLLKKTKKEIAQIQTQLYSTRVSKVEIRS